MRFILLLLLAAPAAAVQRSVPVVSLPALSGVKVPSGLGAIPVLPAIAIPAISNPAPFVSPQATILPQAPEGRPVTALAQAQLLVARFQTPEGKDQSKPLAAAFDGKPEAEDGAVLPEVYVDEAYAPAPPSDSAGNPVIVPGRLKPLLPGTGFDKATWTGRVTLHLHSVFSDGVLEPEKVVKLAYDAGVRSVSMTEHDTTAGTLRAYRAAKALGMDYHTGVEISAKGGAHINGIDVDVSHPGLVAMLASIREIRVKKAAVLVELLNEHPELVKRGITLTLDEVLAKSKHAEGGTVERPHVARLLMDKGLVSSVQEAFDTYLKDLRTGGRGIPEEPSPREVIEMIHAAGGKAVLNHPYTLSRNGDEEAEKAVRAMAAQGLDGIEVYRRAPKRDDASRREADERAARWLMVADDFDLFAAPGSDFHGDDTHLNNPAVWMPKVLADQLLARLSPSQARALAALDALDGGRFEPPAPALAGERLEPWWRSLARAGWARLKRLARP